MLRIAVQAKGRLHEETMTMLEESSIKLDMGKRQLLVSSKSFPVEVLFLRDDDIPQAVATGIADVGIVGENEYVEKGEDATIIKRLDFSKCRLSLAIPKAVEYPGVEWFNGKRIATSYPNILRQFLDKNNVTRRYIDDYLQENLIDVSDTIDISDMGLLIDFAKIGVGVACVIKSFVSRELAKGKLEEIRGASKLLTNRRG